ncbi:LANO_0A06788g1_1 [Lachancea nothofagi CBS 11611]|uniref:LANO_0A06788g1_1 n=1 Tax=Lachancea nothofagi CBS 11611 TaxID=1266666 RepID=A0A1G4ISG5_9SACH|nr:LANO_0A06788g1_1 [Lachancea nothofagi CBS 11611]
MFIARDYLSICCKIPFSVCQHTLTAFKSSIRENSMPNTHMDGFVLAHCVFYSVFHPTEGTKVRHEFPPGCLEASDIRFDTIKNYVIPKAQLCNKLLTLKYGSYRIVCYPVNVVAPYYARNSFSFDFVFVFPYDCATSPYEPAIERLGKMFAVLEEQSQILSKAENSSVYFQLKARDTHKHSTTEIVKETEAPGPLKLGGDVQSQGQGYAFEKYQEILKDLESSKQRLAIDDLIAKIFQDLNNYSECLIPIDSGNSVDIKLFPPLSPPNSSLSFEDVPISTVNLAKLIDASWDPTMLRIVPYIDGINSIAKIARLSDSYVGLVTECIKHFIYYNCVILADIFQFSNIYAPTSEINRFLSDSSLAAECQTYVTFRDSTQISSLPFEQRLAPPNQNNPRTRNSSGTLDTLRKGRTYTTRDGSFTSATTSSVNVYQNTPQSHNSSLPYHSATDAGHSQSEGGEHGEGMWPLPSQSCLFDMYRSLSQGQTVKEWYRIHFEKMRSARIDVRRFITFGVIHGLLYRCYSYPVLKNVGFLEVVKSLNAHKDSKASGSELTSKDRDPLNSILSSADIGVGLEKSKAQLRKGKRQNMLAADAAEEVLNDVYRKLALNESQLDPSSTGNPMSKLFGKGFNRSSGDISTKGSLSSAGSDARNKVAFDITRSMTPGSADERRKNEMNQSIATRRNEELILLKSVRDVENFDKICTRLEKDREEVESMLRDLGPYNVLHT